MKGRAAWVTEVMGVAGPATPERRRVLRRGALVCAGIAVAGGLFWTVGLTRSRAIHKGTAGDVAIKDGDLIRYTRGFASRAGVTTAPAAVVVMSPQVRATGAVTFDPRRFAPVGPRSAGRIRQVHKVAGDKVALGEILAEIDSPELGSADARLHATQARERAAEAQLRRKRRLAEGRADASVEVESALAALEAARVDRITAEQAVKALGGDGQGTTLGALFLRSPMAGRVVAAKLGRGQAVHPNDIVYEIADLESLWVELDVFERDLGSLHVGDVVKILPRANPNAALEGKIAHVGALIDRDARTGSIRVVVDNRAGLLRPGQSVTARIETSSPATKVVTVPVEAVAQVDGQATVFVAVDATTARIREVSTGPEDTRRVAVLEGLREGERVLVGGVSALRSELLR